MIMKGELERVWTDAAVAYFKALYWHYAAGIGVV
jgi:hypothetical protein